MSVIDIANHTGSFEELALLCQNHPVAQHPIFSYLAHAILSHAQIASLLANYDAHACYLRRLLLKAATIMPEPAVGFILENVRNEYGSGNFADNHRAQLLDLAEQSGVTAAVLKKQTLSAGVVRYIREAGRFYFPLKENLPEHLFRPAIAAGAVTATEMMAIAEFKSIQTAFAKLELGHHRWFNHVIIEEKHSDESCALAKFFIEEYSAKEAVIFGINQLLDLTISLYDGLLFGIKRPSLF